MRAMILATAASLFQEVPTRRTGIGSHQSLVAQTHTWLTPPYVIDALGPFDLDPCAAPEPRPWSTAHTHWTRVDGSLNRPWFGRVFLNPPYGPKAQIAPWMRRMAEHGCGTALIFARTETALFFETVWDQATAVLFLKGRLRFHRADGCLPHGNPGRGTAGAPSILIAYGSDDAERLRTSGLAGKWLAL